MKMKPLQLAALSIGLSIIIQSCGTTTYVESTPPPPDYSQPAPPPTYYDNQSQDAAAPVSYQTFYDELSPYGQWINTPDYGYVWIPSAGPDFQPYATSGHWVLTNYGWTWVSDYSWGWAPFHYGTWDFDGTLGWYWIPGYQWSPAWVSWRSEPGYYGWAPLGPNYVSAGYSNYYCPPERYVFVNATYINSPTVSAYYIPRAQNPTYYNRSAVITNTYYDRGSNATYYSGPQSAEVQRYTGAPVRQVTLVQASAPDRAGISGNQVSMFRPAVTRPANNNVTARPQAVYQRTNVTPVTQRQVLTRPNQPRVAPFKPENIQRGQNNTQQQAQPQKPSPQEQQRPAVQQRPQPQQQASPQKPAQQQTPVNQQRTQSQQAPQRPAQQQQRRAPQQGGRRAQPKPRPARSQPKQSQSQPKREESR